MKTSVCKFFCLLFAAAMLLPLFASCGEKETIVGSWKGDFEGSKVLLTFLEDGGGSLKEDDGLTYPLTYTAEKDKITVTLLGQSREYTFTLGGGSLTLKRGETKFELKKAEN